MSIAETERPGPADTADRQDTIRPFAASDTQDVADLLLRAFQQASRPAPAAMADYLRQVYLDAPWYDPEIASRVLVAADGRIIGFIGVSAVPMRFGDEPLRGAVISSLAVDDRFAEAMAAARLLRHVRAGPQDAILSDRSNTLAVTLVRALGAEALQYYSLDWLRVLRPAGFGVAALAARLGPARLLGPLAGLIDPQVQRRLSGRAEDSWLAPAMAAPAGDFTEREIGLDELLDLIPGFLETFTLRPDWDRGSLSHILRDATQKADLGDLVARVVEPRQGPAAGIFLYHLHRGGVAHVLQLFARRGREGIVVDHAIASAERDGAVAIRGRMQPRLLDALNRRRVVYLPELTAMVHARRADIRDSFHRGDAFFNGIFGEYWMRLNGDRFQ